MITAKMYKIYSKCGCTGEINYTKVFDQLAESGYTGRVGFELFPKTTTAEAVKAIMTY